MILEYCNSDIYFDIYHLQEKKKKKHERSVLLWCFILIRHPLLPFSKCLISKSRDRGKKTTKKKKRNGKIRLEFKKEHGGEVR